MHSWIWVCGKMLFIASGKPFRPSTQAIKHAQPELCAFIFGQPHAQQLFPAFGVDPQRQENSFVDYATILTNFYDDTVHVNNGIQRIQLSILPLSNLLFYGIRDFG